jgi:hypothetical protein
MQTTPEGPAGVRRFGRFLAAVYQRGGSAFRPESGGRFSALRDDPREAGKSVVIFLLLLRLEEPGP